MRHDELIGNSQKRRDYQIIWPNNDGHYPWSPSATKAFKEWQPVLGAAPSRT
jgi:hypothetical protein